MACSILERRVSKRPSVQAIVETLAEFAVPLYRAFAKWNDYYGLVYCIYATITVVVLGIALYVVRYFRKHKIGAKQK